MNSKLTDTALGALTGVVTLIGMLRLVDGVSAGPISRFALIFILLAMVPWVGYVAWRARRSRLTSLRRVVVLTVVAVGLACVWLFTFGAVVALACSFAGFVVIWVSDLPQRPPAEESRFVRVEELTGDEG